MNDFLLNDVVVRPRLNEIQIAGRSEKLPAKFIDVLMVLAERQGEVLGKSELLKRVWNDPLIGEESLSNAVWMLRKTLGDDAKRPAYIETVPRRGYRLIASVARLHAVALPSDPMSVGLERAPEHLAMEPLPAPTPAEIPTPTPALAARASRHRLQRPLIVLLGSFAAASLLLWWSLIAPHVAKTPDARVLAFRTGGNLASIDLPNPGTALVADRVGNLYAVDALKGVERWRFAAGGRIQLQPLATAERLFIGSEDTYLYALDSASGRELWRHAAGHSLQSAPLASEDDVIYADTTGRVRALCGRDGRPRWQLQLDARAVGSILGPLDLAVLRTLNGTLIALARYDGAIRWQRSFAGPFGDLVADGNSQVLFASDAGFITAVDANDGATLWQAELPSAELTPLLVGDRVYALGRYGDMVALRNADGSVLWRARMDIGDPHDLVWWRDRVVVILDGGRLGIIDPTNGRIERMLSLPENPDDVAANAERLMVALQSGRVIAIDRDALDRFDHGRLIIDAQARLRLLDAPQAGRQKATIEAMQPGAPLSTLL